MGKMSEEIKRARQQAKLAAMFGIEEALPEPVTPPTNQQLKAAQDVSREAEAVLFYLYDSRKFVQKECLHCGFVFAVNRGNVGYCSDDCRIRELDRRGITWDSNKDDSERWEFREPLTVHPQVLEHLGNYLQLEDPSDAAVQQMIEFEIQNNSVDELLAELGID